MTRRTQPFLTAAAALTCLLVTSCTSSGESYAPDPAATAPIAIHTGDETQPGAEAPSPVTGEACHIATRLGVAREFGGGSGVTELVSTTALGNPVCTFTVRTSNLGLPGVLTVTSYAKGGPGIYRRARADARHAGALHPLAVHRGGDRAFYAARTGTIELLTGQRLLVISAVFRVPAGRSAPAARLKADLTTLAESLEA